MKKYILFLLVLLSVGASAQIQVDSMIVKQKFKLNGFKATAISNDTATTAGDTSTLITKSAARKFSSGGGGFNPSASQTITGNWAFNNGFQTGSNTSSGLYKSTNETILGDWNGNGNSTLIDISDNDNTINLWNQYTLFWRPNGYTDGDDEARVVAAIGNDGSIWVANGAMTVDQYGSVSLAGLAVGSSGISIPTGDMSMDNITLHDNGDIELGGTISGNNWWISPNGEVNFDNGKIVSDGNGSFYTNDGPIWGMNSDGSAFFANNNFTIDHSGYTNIGGGLYVAENGNLGNGNIVWDADGGFQTTNGVGAGSGIYNNYGLSALGDWSTLIGGTTITVNDFTNKAEFGGGLDHNVNAWVNCMDGSAVFANGDVTIDNSGNLQAGGQNGNGITMSQGETIIGDWNSTGNEGLRFDVSDNDGVFYFNSPRSGIISAITDNGGGNFANGNLTWDNVGNLFVKQLYFNSGDNWINEDGVGSFNGLYNNTYPITLTGGAFIKHSPLTTTQINALTSPQKGWEVFNSTLNTICFYNGTSWQKVTSTGM